jgi:hypothetical protein
MQKFLIGSGRHTLTPIEYAVSIHLKFEEEMRNEPKHKHVEQCSFFRWLKIFVEQQHESVKLLFLIRFNPVFGLLLLV